MRMGQHKAGLFLFALLLIVLLLPLFSAQAEDGQVRGVVWLDRALDGVNDGEPGFADARIALEKKESNGAYTAVDSLTTGRTGEIAFDGVPDGTYRLSIELPKDYYVTFHGQDSMALPAQGRRSQTTDFAVSGGQTAQVNIGVTRSNANISVIAFEDADLSGGRGNRENLIRRVQIDVIYVYDGQEYLVATEYTGQQGQELIQFLSPGTYFARVTLPDRYMIGPMGSKINNYHNCFHPNEDNTGYSDPFTIQSQGSLSLGVGVVRTGGLTGKIWYDQNYNGKWDLEESGLADAEIILHSSALGLSRTAQIDAKGNFAFDFIQPGDYKLKVSLPEGMVFTYPGESLITAIASSASVGVTIQADVTTPLSPIGAMPSSSLALALYEDLNLNGAWDDQEPALAGATVTVYQGGKKADSQVTDLEGRALFSSLRSGDTVVHAALPDGFVFSADESALFAFEGAQTEAEFTVTLGDAEEADRLYTAAAVPAAAIRGILFENPVHSGLYQEGSSLLSGFTVQAVDENGAIAASAETEDGAFLLYPLLPGDYTVRYLLNDPYVAAPYAADAAPNGSRIVSQTPEYGETAPITLTPGALAADVNAAVFRAGTVHGLVSLSGGEGGIRGVRVTLTDEDGAQLSDFSYGVTDETGAFLIKGVLPGVYSLTYTMPDDAAFTQPMTDERNVYVGTFTAESGSEIEMPALEGVYTSVYSGQVRTNADVDGAIRIALTSQETGVVYETEAELGEDFRIALLRPGAYTVTADLPEGLVFGASEHGLFSLIPSSHAESPLTFDLGDHLLNADIYAARPVTVSGNLFLDENVSAARDSQEQGVSGRAVTLSGGGLTFVQATDADGRFAFDMLPPGGYALSLPLEAHEMLVGVPVTEDGKWQVNVTADENTDVSLALVQYASIAGRIWNLDGSDGAVSEVPVALLDASGAAIDATQTDETGAFAFDGLLPGEYSLSATLPEGYLFARAQDASDRPSYIQSQTGTSPAALPIAVAMGARLTGIDVGMGAMGTLGDRAWLDVNGNGLQDVGEPDVPGIVIELYQHGELAASTVTDAFGRYLLTDLYPGEYEMHVTMHEELTPTVRNDSFPLLNSVLPSSEETTVIADGIVVPSGGQNLHCDLGFRLVTEGVYPDALSTTPAKDWKPYSQR